MKRMIINWLLPTVFDALLSALSALSKQSDNTIDDALVESLVQNKEKIIGGIKASL